MQPATIGTIQCICGKPIAQPATGRPRAYCSDACKQRAYRQTLVTRVTKVDNINRNTIFFSGIEKAATANILVKEQACGMMSQLLYRDSLLAACKDIPLVFDSGAFTKALSDRDIESYAALIARLGTRGLWYANADEIGNQERSERNYRYLLSLLPEALHERILWIYQASAPISYLYRAVQDGHKRIGIGGLVPLFQSPDKTMGYQKIRECARVIAGSGREIIPQYFGMSIPQVIQELHAYHRAFTVDSTTWLIGGKYGLLVGKNGKQRSAKELGYDFATEELLRQNVRTMKKWMDRPEHVELPEGYAQTSWLEEAVS